MRRTLDLARLEQFVAVAKLGSFGKASTVTLLSQPTLTRNMRGLEADVGAQLFDRGPLGTTLTAAGRRFLPRAEALLNDAERAMAELELGDDGTLAQVRIGVSPNVFFHVLDDAIALLASATPNVNVLVISGTREAIAEQLRCNAIDLGLCLVPDFFYQAGNEASDIIFEAVGAEHIQAFAQSDHPAASATQLEDVLDYRWAVPHQLSVSYRFESAFYRRRLPVPPQAINTASLSLLRSCVLRHGMLGLLPAHFAKPDVEAGRLAALDIAELRFEGALGLMQRRDSAPNPITQQFGDFIRQAAKDG